MSVILGLCCGVVAVVALGATVSFYVAHRFTTPKRIAPVPDPAGLPVWCEAITLHARVDGVRLAAWYAPVPQAIGAVIVVHGRDACKGDVLRGAVEPLVRALHQNRISVLLIDLRGHGESAAARLTFGAFESRDVLAGIDYLRARGFADAAIGVLGASMGGAAAIAAAAVEPALGVLVTDSAFADLHALLRMQFPRMTRLPVWMLRSSLWCARHLTGVSLVRDVPQELIARRRGGASLIIHAAADPFVPVWHAHALAERAACHLWITEGRKHLSSYSVEGDVYLETVSTFFAAHFVSTEERGAADANRATTRLVPRASQASVVAARTWTRELAVTDLTAPAPIARSA
jgi:uncharacterized protein